MQSSRLLSCLLLLQSRRRLTARELAERFEVSTRTIYRDVDALCAAGLPIHTERGPLGGIVLDDGYRRALAQFTQDDLRALFATGTGPMADLDLTPEAALQKLAGALPEMQRRAAQTGRDRLHVDQNRWSRTTQPREFLRRLRAASEADRRVRIGYRDRGGSASLREVDPLGLVAKAGVWYLVAREAMKGYRSFRVERIESVELLPAAFVRPAEFDLERYWNDSVRQVETRQELYEVVVRVRHDAVRRLRPYWNVVVVLEEGETATLRIGFPSTETALVQLLVLGDAVRVVEPADLPARIVAAARAAIAHHDPSRGAPEPA